MSNSKVVEYKPGSSVRTLTETSNDGVRGKLVRFLSVEGKFAAQILGLKKVGKRETDKVELHTVSLDNVRFVRTKLPLQLSSTLDDRLVQYGVSVKNTNPTENVNNEEVRKLQDRVEELEKSRRDILKANEWLREEYKKMENQITKLNQKEEKPKKSRLVPKDKPKDNRMVKLKINEQEFRDAGITNYLDGSGFETTLTVLEGILISNRKYETAPLQSMDLLDVDYKDRIVMFEDGTPIFFNTEEEAQQAIYVLNRLQ